jgi:hypothetical protein
MKRLLAVLVAVSLSGCERIVYRDAPTGATPVAEATPAPLAPSLRFPQGVPEAEIGIIPGQPALYEVLNAEIAAMFPNCKDGDVRCDGLGYSAQSFFLVLNQRLRARGYWAGQHREGQSDEMTITRDCKGEWENYHAWDYNGSPLWARPVSSPCAGHACTGKGTSYRGNTVIPARYCQ